MKNRDWKVDILSWFLIGAVIVLSLIPPAILLLAFMALIKYLCG